MTGGTNSLPARTGADRPPVACGSERYVDEIASEDGTLLYASALSCSIPRASTPFWSFPSKGS
jgi:hypothetical protein